MGHHGPAVCTCGGFSSHRVWVRLQSRGGGIVAPIIEPNNSTKSFFISIGRFMGQQPHVACERFACTHLAAAAAAAAAGVAGPKLAACEHCPKTAQADHVPP